MGSRLLVPAFYHHVIYVQGVCRAQHCFPSLLNSVETSRHCMNTSVGRVWPIQFIFLVTIALLYTNVLNGQNLGNTICVNASVEFIA